VNSVQPTIELFPRVAIMDVRDAMALSLRRLVEGIRFKGAQGTDRFAAVHDDWPSFNEKYTPPAACVLPGDFKYLDWATSPTLMEETWWPNGLPGWGLYKVAEVQTEFQLVIRTNLVGERQVIMHAVEDAFQSTQMLMDHRRGAMYGLFQPMPEYYSLQARFALLGGSVLDSEDKAMREQREAAFTVSATAAKVQVGSVYPLANQILVRVNGETV